MEEQQSNTPSELREQLQLGKISRREFIRTAAALGMGLGATQLMTGCDQGSESTPSAPPTSSDSPETVSEESQAVSESQPVTMEKDWQVMINYDKCCGCRICELECAMQHFGVINPDLARIKIYKVYPGVDVAMYCRNCWDNPCIEVCPTDPKAIYKDEATGATKINMDLCIECDKCIEECPAHVIRYRTDVGYLACDLCDLEPACVAACPTGALEVVPGVMAPERWALPLEQVARQRMEKIGLAAYSDKAFGGV